MALPIDLPADLLDAFVRGARRGHEIAARSHVDEEGWDSSTFGFVRYRLSWNWIAEYLDEVDDIDVLDRTNCLRVRWGSYEFGFYNGEIGADWDPRTFEFDATARRAEVGFANMSPFPGMEPEPSDLQHLLVVYTASPERGCLRVYLGAPITNPTTNATSWSWIEEISSAPRSGDERTVDGTPTWPGFRDIHLAEPELGMRDETESDDRDSGAGAAG